MRVLLVSVAALLAGFFGTLGAAQDWDDSCGTPVKSLKWHKKASKTTYHAVASQCDCRLQCEVVHNSLNYVSWYWSPSTEKCYCVDADFRAGQKALKLKKVKLYDRELRKTPRWWTGETKKGHHKSRVVRLLDDISEMTAEYFSPWSLIVTVENEDAKQGFERIYEFVTNTTTAEPLWVASQSKWVAAYAILREMAAAGHGLDEPVCPFVEGWDCDMTGEGVPDAGALSIKNLLAFQSGSRGAPTSNCPIPADVPQEEYASWTVEMCTREIVKSGVFTETPLKFFEYNHYHLALANAAIVGLSGKTTEKFTSDALEALGMDNSQFLKASDFYRPFGLVMTDLIDLGGTLFTNPDDLEKFHMGYISRTWPGVPDALYDEMHAERFTNTTEMASFDNITVTWTGDTVVNFGSYGFGHWIGCSMNYPNPKGPMFKYDWCFENADHHSMGAYGAMAFVDTTRRFMVQSVPHPNAPQGPLKTPQEGFDNMGIPLSLLVTEVVKLLLEKVMEPSVRSREVCFHLCLVQYNLNFNYTGSYPYSTVEEAIGGVFPEQVVGYRTYRDQLHDAIGCGACPEDFDPSEPWYE